MTEITPQLPEHATPFQMEGLDGSAVQLEPGSRYLIVIDSGSRIDPETARRVRADLDGMGIKATILHGGSLRVFELK